MSTDEDGDELKSEDGDDKELVVPKVRNEISEEGDDSKLVLDVSNFVVLDWRILELKLDTIALVEVEDIIVPEDSFLELELGGLELGGLDEDFASVLLDVVESEPEDDFRTELVLELILLETLKVESERELL